MTRKLEKIARQYRIDPSSLPEIDGKSITVSSQPSTAQQVTVLPLSPQAEGERLKREFEQARQRLLDFKAREQQRRQAALRR